MLLQDLISCLLLPSPRQEQLPEHVRAQVALVLLGPAAVADKALGVVSHGGTAACEGSVLGLLTPGERSQLLHLQGQLSVNRVLDAVREVMLAGVVAGLQPGVSVPALVAAVRSSLHGVLLQPEGLPLPQLQAAVASALVGHAPLRSCLLADIKALKSGIVGLRAALVAGLLSGVERGALWALPQRVLMQSLIKGVLYVMTPSKLVPLCPLVRHAGGQAALMHSSAMGLLPIAVTTQPSAVAAAAIVLNRGQSSISGGSAAAVAPNDDVPRAPDADAAAVGLHDSLNAAVSAHAVGEARRLLGLLVVLAAVGPLVVEVVGELLSLMLAEQVLGEAHGGTAATAAVTTAVGAGPGVGVMQVSY